MCHRPWLAAGRAGRAAGEGTQCSLCLDVKHLAWGGLHGKCLAVVKKADFFASLESQTVRVNVPSAISRVFMFSEGKLFGPGS